jgi:hypothetical protein
MTTVISRWWELLAYPPPHEQRRREQFAEALRAIEARQRPPAERPSGLPKGRVVERRLLMGVRRIQRGALPAAWLTACCLFDRALTDDDWRSSTPTYAAQQLLQLLPAIRRGEFDGTLERDPEQRVNLLHRAWKRHRRVLHLAMPLLDRLWSDRLNRERAANDDRTPLTLADLLADSSWADPASAERWRTIILQRWPHFDLLPVAGVIS